ncbi:MAG: hypothetical protein ACOYON_10425 [Fimbriimonas sp.]
MKHLPVLGSLRAMAVIIVVLSHGGFHKIIPGADTPAADEALRLIQASPHSKLVAQQCADSNAHDPDIKPHGPYNNICRTTCNSLAEADSLPLRFLAGGTIADSTHSWLE